MEPPIQQINNQKMNMSLLVFKEPRGVMRIIQFIFAIIAFSTTTSYTNDVEINFQCETNNKILFNYSYPFSLDHIDSLTFCNNQSFHLVGDFSSDAQFFVATGVLSFLYCVAIGIVYLLYDNAYQSNALYPLTDFILTVTLAVFWLSGSAAWANGLSGLKHNTLEITTSKQCMTPDKMSLCLSSKTGDFFKLNVSVILGFLNFFLWASDLWFLYKETPWFKMKQGGNNPGVDA